MLMFCIVGFVVGLGITLVRKFPKLGDFLAQRPILGWTLAFGVGSVVVTALIAIAEAALLMLLTR